MEVIPLPQPPASAPAPPVGKRSRWLMVKITLAAVMLSLLAFAAVFMSQVFKASDREVALIQARKNAPKIMAALMDFDATYGSFPNEATAPRVAADTGTKLNLRGGSSNAMFRQLLVRGTSESIFHVPGAGAAAKAPDEVFTDNAHALAPGECGFAYIAGLSSSSDSNCPVIVAPLQPGATKFEPAHMPNCAVVGFADGRVETMEIDGAGRLMKDGLELLDPAQPYWKGSAPDIRWQE